MTTSKKDHGCTSRGDLRQAAAEQIRESKFLSKVFLSATPERYEKFAYVVLMSWAVAAPATVLVREHYYTYCITVFLASLCALYWLISKSLIRYIARTAARSVDNKPEESIGWKQKIVRFRYRVKDILIESPWSFLLGGALCWSILSFLVMTEDWQLAFYGGNTIREGLSANFFYALIYIYAVRIQSERRKRTILSVTAIGSIILAIVFICPYIKEKICLAAWLDEWLYLWSQPNASIFLNSNYYGYYLAVILSVTAGLLLTAKKRLERLIWLFVIVVNTFVLVKNNTFGSYLAVAVIFLLIPVLYAIHKRCIHWSYFVPIAVFSGISVLMNLKFCAPVGNNLTGLATDLGAILTDAEEAQRAGSGRWGLWLAALELIKKKPFFGCGPEQMIPYLQDAIGYACRRPHNEYLQHTAMYGIPAGLMYLGALGTIAVAQLRKLKQLPEITLIAGCAVIGYAVSAFFGLTTYNTTPYLYLVLGMASCRIYRNETCKSIRA